VLNWPTNIVLIPIKFTLLIKYDDGYISMFSSLAHKITLEKFIDVLRGLDAI